MPQLTVVIETPDAAATGAFWAGLLGREAVEADGGALLPATSTQVGLRFVPPVSPLPSRRVGGDLLHLHVTSESVDDQRRIVEAALGLGGRRRGSGPLPFGRVLYLADPGGSGFCVIEPGNRYLEGCGPLGEVTCDGSVEAARFWCDALRWTVVWEEGDQVAIQSPDGGTKIGWDRWPDPAAPERGRGRQHFELTTPDSESEVTRLLALGATVHGDEGGAATLVDPDGEVFTVRRA